MTTVAIIGCTHAGTFAATSILKTHPDWTIHVFERNDSLSFLSCGIALWVGNHVSDPNDMFYSSPQALADAGAIMHMRHDVTSVDITGKTLEAKDLESGETASYHFDKLVVTTGSKPSVPPIEGLTNAMEHGGVLLSKNWDNALVIKESTKTAKSAIVIGAGYIGAELAAQLSQIEIQTTLVDSLDHVLTNNFDTEIAEIIEPTFTEHDVTLALGQAVTGFRPGVGGDGNDDSGVTVVTTKGEYTADIAILAVGVRPNNALIAGQLRTLSNGAIIVDDHMRASLPDGTVLEDVFAAGDSASVRYSPTGTDDYIPLATNAVRQGLLVGDNIDGANKSYLGTQATSAAQFYDLSMAATGLTLAAAQRRGIDAQSTTLTEDYRPDFMPTTSPITAILVWERATKRVLGAQFICEHDLTMAANVVSVAIQAGFALEDLAGADFFFQPNFGQPVNFIGAAAMQALDEC